MASKTSTAVKLAACVAIAAAAYFAREQVVTRLGLGSKPQAATVVPAAADRAEAADVVDLPTALVGNTKVQPVQPRLFPIEKEAIGSIDFNGEMTEQVFTPYQGRIIEAFAKVGQDVAKGQTLFTIDSPDLLTATSALIASSGVKENTTRNLARQRELAKTKAVPQKDLEQAISDQQTAEGNYKASRDTVRLFGKSDADMDRMIAERKPDSVLVVPSPLAGRITQRNAAPGLFVQPGNAPAPYSVADISTMWMLASIPESDSPEIRVGQSVKAKVLAFPDREFDGKISTIGASVDTATRRLLVRSEIADPEHLLRQNMFTTFVIRVAEPVSALAVPDNGVVREGDGTMTVWATTDRRQFQRRVVTTGLRRDGYVQILAGLKPDELVVTDGAVFLSNKLANQN